jgi:hypothetical protein
VGQPVLHELPGHLGRVIRSGCVLNAEEKAKSPPKSTRANAGNKWKKVSR